MFAEKEGIFMVIKESDTKLLLLLKQIEKIKTSKRKKKEKE